MFCSTKQEAIAYLTENDVKFVKCTFLDAAGKLRNISVLASRAEEIFGTGVRVDASFVDGFASPDLPDLWLLPDPITLTTLPWRPSEGRVARVFCELVDVHGEPFPLDCRRLLRGAAKRAREAGLDLRIGSLCEFYLFRKDENGQPTTTPADRAGFMDVFPDDACENVRRDIDLTLEEMGILPESSHHECGPGQNEIDFRSADPLTAADQFVLFCNVVRSVAAGYGLWADFSPMPILGEAGNGLHVAFTVSDTDKSPEENESEATRRAFLGGILAHIREITAFLDPTEESYRRFGKGKAPRIIGYSECNRDQLIKLHRPAAMGIGTFNVISPDPTANPYLAFALLIHAGLDGVEAYRAGSMTDPTQDGRFEVGADPKASYPEERLLPTTLTEAERLAAESEFVRRILPGDTVARLFRARHAAN